ncbi:MAG: DUF6747 family protein [Cellulophaga sp.]|uniref:DUF6747 family protein n=1 Tax=unclassified Cellulophaga TaxID=2634405 RepID=UPI002E8E0E35|nr:DUF6747 family protein [Cellulophaga sp. RHA19]
MKGILLCKEIYVNGFKNLGHFILKNYFKMFSWFCFTLIVIAAYALMYRVLTGYAFV